VRTRQRPRSRCFDAGRSVRLPLVELDVQRKWNL